MLISELEEMVLSGQYKLDKHVTEKTKSVSVYSKTKGEFDTWYRKIKGKDTLCQKWFGEFEGYKSVKYNHTRHMIVSPDGHHYKINKKIYEKLSKKLTCK